MIDSWQALEEFAYDLIKADHPTLPKGSGSAKKEEDIVGTSTIIQCKYTEDKNMSILNKDLTRLLEACALQGKFPLFVTSNKTNTVLSIPINDDNRNIINMIIDVITIIKRAEIITDNISLVKTMPQFKLVEKHRDRINILMYGIKNRLESIARKADIKLNAKYDDLTICDLFEGVKDGTNKN